MTLPRQVIITLAGVEFLLLPMPVFHYLFSILNIVNSFDKIGFL